MRSTDSRPARGSERRPTDDAAPRREHGPGFAWVVVPVLLVAAGLALASEPPPGTIQTVAGGSLNGSGDGNPATSASLRDPRAVAVDGTGRIFIADPGRHSVRGVATDGTITTVAGGVGIRIDGGGFGGFSGDGGPAASAKLNFPVAVAVDGIGNLFIADWGNLRIRRVATSRAATRVSTRGASIASCASRWAPTRSIPRRSSS